MELCSNAIPLRLEDDGPTEGVRRIHWVDIMKPCWIWKDAPLAGATRITAEVGQMPFNFAIGDDEKPITNETPATDRKSLGSGKSKSGPVHLGGRRIKKKKKKK